MRLARVQPNSGPGRLLTELYSYLRQALDPSADLDSLFDELSVRVPYSKCSFAI